MNVNSFGTKVQQIIVMVLVELKNRLIEEDRYMDSVDDLLVRFMS